MHGQDGMSGPLRLGFFHDAPLFSDSVGQVYSIGFGYEVWRRYLEIFDAVGVHTRMRPGDNAGKQLSSGEGVEFCPIKSYSGPSTMLRGRAIQREVRTALSTCDAAIVRLPSVIGLMACSEAHQLGKPYAVEVVGCGWDAFWYRNFMGKLIAPFIYLAMRQCVSQAAQVLYVSDSFLQKRYPTRGQSVACSDVALRETHQNASLGRSERVSDLSGRRLVLGTIGATDVRYKGQDVVMRAAARLVKRGVDLEYHLVGSGSTTHLKKLAKKLRIENRVLFHGVLASNAVADFLVNVDIYIQPSLTEGRSRAILEAMSVGCPVIGSDVGGIPENVASELLFPPRDYRALADRITRLLDGGIEAASKYSLNQAAAYSPDQLAQTRRGFLSVLRDRTIQGLTTPGA